jgi:hypothetical protein
MRFLRLAAVVAALVPAAVAAQPTTPVDLSTWTQQGPLGNGRWTVAPGGQSVTQGINGDPTFFVSPGNVLNQTIRGRITVNDGSDDDLVGFVFGFQSATAANAYDFVLFDWKANNQPSGCCTSFEGFALSRVNGTITDYIPGFWGRTDSTGFDNLANRYSATDGWQVGVTYDFTIAYLQDRITIDLAGGAFGTGTTIFDLAGAFPDGRFGFYNYSQAGVTYAGLTSQVTPPVAAISEPETYALMAAGLGLLGAAAKRRRARAKTA